MTAPTIIPGKGVSGILLICDHASNAVPEGMDLGIDASWLSKHIGIDIGAGPLTEALAQRLEAPALLATVSRLVIDLHRQPDHPALIPAISDGHVIPGNAKPDRAERIARFHGPYHRALADLIRAERPTLLASIHSFTPKLESGQGADRPWHIGILSNRDRRAANAALAWLKAHNIPTGDNEPYSGRLLNATLNRHGEANGITSIAIEVRNDLIADADGVAHWAGVLSEMLMNLRNGLAPKGPFAT